MKITFTGHRPNKLGFEYDFKGKYTDYIKNELELTLNHLQPERANTGMALGFDMISAIVCIKMGIPLHCWIPCKDQEKVWKNDKLIKIYHTILSKATAIHQVSNEPYNNHCMQDRNEAMIDDLNPKEDKLISCHDGSYGGTWNCIRYANSKGFRSKDNIININPENVRYF